VKEEEIKVETNNFHQQFSSSHDPIGLPNNLPSALLQKTFTFFTAYFQGQLGSQPTGN